MSTVGIKKADQQLQVVYGEVYAPNIPDSQGDYMTAEEIRKMAWNWLRKGQTHMVDVNHDNQLYGCAAVESFIARDDDTLFIPGSWVIGIHIPDQALWAKVENQEINGFSLEAMAVQTRGAREFEIPETMTGYTDEESGHVHKFEVSFDKEGEFLGGQTDEVDGHSHKIVKGTLTETSDGHAHRFSFVEGLVSEEG